MIGVLRQQSVRFGKALPVQVSHRFAAESAVFDEDSLVSLAGLVPVMRLAEQTGLGQLLSEKVRIIEPRIKSGSANPTPNLTRLIAGMCSVAGGPTPARVRGGWSPPQSAPPAPPGPAGRFWCAAIRPMETARWWPPVCATTPSSRW